ncbi:MULTISPECIES: ribosome small subunit-dependent GTPase A [unclassified Fusibacter]|uniref:ribosome small subunit-dependent GTPase A n=1 Tax=unclassified Fusibacter TaxID=2624464 RepID=UPI0013E9938E|nr:MULTISPECIES: ribosome small subunit-dependent GTPase A [unclassified Fusibacter]MCK8058615.1 ribosome small subunit-dependent GTPase A [Fusibacter sp. A2]NPE22615.1 ribosome small subunit-dependent GTPase A [Fusibacter sp. A1]
MTDYQNEWKGRVIASHGKLVTCLINDVEVNCEVAGSFFNQEVIDLPTVGDWVFCDRDSDKNGRAIVHRIEERTSEFSRKVAGGRLDKQVIAANIDTIFILMSLNHDLNFSRLLRYVTISKSSGANVEVVLTKSDLMPEAIWVVEDIKSQSGIEHVHVISVLTNDGMEELKSRIKPEQTIVFVGSSGVGKSTLTNTLLGEEVMSIGGLRNDDRGRHTTTHRQMLKTESGAWLIDTPGMREISFIDQTDGLSEAFSDITELIDKCRFNDCSHKNEPGCAINHALDSGELSEWRFAEYSKYLKEMAFFESKMRRKLNKDKKNKK